MVAETRIFATTDNEKAAVFAAFYKGQGDNVVVIKTTDQIFLKREKEEFEPWDSGEDKDWILIIATSKEMVSPGPSNFG